MRKAHNKGKSRLKTITGRTYYYDKKDRVKTALALTGSMTFMIFLMGYRQITDMINTWQEIPTQVEAREIVVVPEPTPTPKPQTEKEQILSYIVEVFGDDAVEAIKIAQCESGFKPDRLGDTHLMSYDAKHDEMIGDSLGIFQVRTGGEGWNRARANGLTADEFRTKLKDYKYNIDYAKTIFDRAGDWHDWYNCMIKTGV